MSEFSIVVVGLVIVDIRGPLILQPWYWGWKPYYSSYEANGCTPRAELHSKCDDEIQQSPQCLFFENWGRVDPSPVDKCLINIYTLSEAWSGVNWADLMAWLPRAPLGPIFMTGLPEL